MFETQSEQDFVHFCRRQNWVATKLCESKAPGVRTPDFLVRTATDYEFIVEVTEFEPEPPLDPGQFRTRGHTLGNPLRAKLTEKKGPVKAYSQHLPTLIVIGAGFESPLSVRCIGDGYRVCLRSYKPFDARLRQNRVHTR